jgi:hypothetical protein
MLLADKKARSAAGDFGSPPFPLVLGIVTVQNKCNVRARQAQQLPCSLLKGKHELDKNFVSGCKQSAGRERATTAWPS